MKKILLVLFMSFLFISSVNANIEKKVIDYKISPNFSGIEQFYIKNLSNEQTQKIKDIYSNFETKSKEIFFKNKCTTITDMQELVKNFYISLDKYINKNKTGEFYQYMVDNSNIITKGVCQTKPYIIFTKSYKIVKKKFFSEEQRKIIKEKLSTIPESKLQSILNILIERIDSYIARINNTIKIAKLEELKEIVIEFRDNIDVNKILDINELIK